MYDVFLKLPYLSPVGKKSAGVETTFVAGTTNVHIPCLTLGIE